MNEFAIEVKNLSKSFKFSKKRKNKIKRSSNNRLKVLDDISFYVKKGEALGIIGANGSGKTTLLRIISGVYKPDTGNVKINGRLSPLMQIGAGFLEEFTARENIISNGMLLGLPKSEIEKKVDDIIQYAELEEFSNLRIKHYSSGMRARLAFATAMQMNPDILLVDEIISVGDKAFQEKSFQTFISFKNQNKTILIVSHSLENLSRFCDRILLIHKGKVIMIGIPNEVIEKYCELIITEDETFKNQD